MKQNCATCGPCGLPMPAEEYAACFVPACPDVRRPKPVEEGCCCKEGFRAALGLLDNEELAELLDMEQAVFITDDYAAGAATTGVVAADGQDDLAEPLEGAFRRFSPCCCDLLEITAPLYALPGTATGLTAQEVSLCALTAAAVQLAEATAEGDLTPEEVAARNFRRVKRNLSRSLRPCGEEENSCCKCVCGGDCCCTAGVLAALAGNNLSRRVSLAAGALLLSGVTLLGTVGNVLVLAGDITQRIYFVCASKVEFLV